MSEIQFTDRYKELGIPYPDQSTMCNGQCEGCGFFPENDKRSPLWKSAHKKALIKSFGLHFFKCDGWHFVKCPDCNGSGKRITRYD